MRPVDNHAGGSCRPAEPPDNDQGKRRGAPELFQLEHGNTRAEDNIGAQRDHDAGAGRHHFNRHASRRGNVYEGAKVPEARRHGGDNDRKAGHNKEPHIISVNLYKVDSLTKYNTNLTNNRMISPRTFFARMNEGRHGWMTEGQLVKG